MTKAVYEIVQEYLVANGLDGLYNESSECACLASDLAPCCGVIDACLAGYRTPCDCGEGCDFHIGPDKEVRENEID